jgi:hypothetical protein
MGKKKDTQIKVHNMQIIINLIKNLKGKKEIAKK